MNRRLAAAVLMITALLGAAACATGPSLTPAQMQAVREGQQSAVIMSYREYAGMYGAWVRLVNVETGVLYQVEMHGGTNIVNAGPDMVAVPPGRYRVESGTLYTADSTATLPLLSWWFEPFDVAPGEVVNVGTLRIEDVHVRSVPGLGEQVINALLTFNPNRSDRYLVYSVDYSDEARVAQMLTSKYPTLGVVPVQRPLAVRIDRSAFEQVIVEAYSLNPDGSPPTVQQAQAHVGVALEQVVRDGGR